MTHFEFQLSIRLDVRPCRKEIEKGACLGLASPYRHNH